MTASVPAQKRILPLLLCLAGVAGGLLALFAMNQRFFFCDDRQAQYFPYGLAIKNALLKGEFPFLTVHTFYGGALWPDWQYGIYNPFSLLMDFLIMPQHLELSGFLFGLVSCLLVAAGAYRLGRAYALTPDWAAVLGLVAGLDIYLVYFTATDWHPGATSLGWLLFAWAALKDLVAAERKVSLHVLAAAIFMYLMVSAGWPHSDFAFAGIAGVLFLETVLTQPPRAKRLVAAGLLGAALCLPVIVPTLIAFPWTARGTITLGVLFTPALRDIVSFSNPLWMPAMLTSGDRKGTDLPVFYLAWFALPLLCLIDWKKLHPRNLLGLGALAEIFFLMAAAGAGPLLTLRCPFRWVIYGDISGLLALLIMVQDGKLVLSRGRVALSFAALILPMCLSVVLHHPQAEALICAGLGTLSLAGLIMILQSGDNSRAPAFLGGSTLAVLLLIFSAYPRNTVGVDWGKADAMPATPASSGPLGYAYLYGDDYTIPPEARDQREYPTSATGIYSGVDTFSGYSSLGQKGIEALMRCSENAYVLCQFPPQWLMKREAETGARYLDLFRIDRVIFEKKLPDNFIRKASPPGWQRQVHDVTVVYQRPEQITLPGTLSWHSEGLRVGGPSALQDNAETMQVKNTGKPGLLVFARLFYPGFHASLDGAPLTARPVKDMLVGVEVPANAAGTLTLSFLPPGLALCAALAALALLIWAWFAWKERRA